MARDDGSSRKTVLIVGHDEALHSLAVGALVEFDVLVAKSGAEGLFAIDKLEPDIVLVDSRAVVPDVAQTLRSIRRSWPDGPQLVVLLESGEPRDRIACYEAGADDVIQLPASEMEILAKCRVHASLRREAQLSRLKSQVLDMVAHELRTPLTGILVAAETLGSKYGADGQDRGWFELINDCTRRLEMLADHGLLLCQLRSNMLEIDLRESDIAALVRKVAREQDATAHTHRVHIEVQAPGPVLAWVDRHCFELLLRYLIEGALRWCRADSHLVLSIGSDEQCAWLSLSASMQAGLPQHPFSEFAPRTAGGQLVGGHFGLSLVRELVQAQGGNVDLVSTKSDELSVTCRVPRDPPERRKATRFRTHVASLLTMPDPVASTVIDVSTTGCLLEADSHVQVEVQTRDGEPVRGRIVRVMAREGRLRFGINFDYPLTPSATAAFVLGREPVLHGPVGQA